jgi:hypothetical protein
MVLKREVLERETKKYWTKLDERDRPDIDDYVDNLLPLELSTENEFRQIKVSPDDRCDVLFLLVGYSLEPLLQSICVHHPPLVILVLNKKLSTTIEGRGLDHELRRAAKRACLNDEIRRTWHATPPVFETLSTGDTPQEVFRVLRNKVLSLLDEARRRGASPPRVVVDITGAKKSMTAGAYLLAAYADVKVTYVDFDEYSPRFGRAFGYTCQIGPLENPYRIFRIAEWQRVRELYGQYAFQAALETLNVIAPDAEGPDADKSFFEPKELEAIKVLRAVLGVYDQWENGNLHQAHALAVAGVLASVPRTIWPTAVEELGRDWPHVDPGSKSSPGDFLKQVKRLETGGGDLSRSLFLHQGGRLLVTYARDELAKIRRLIDPKSDFRSALLRSAGLFETLLKARLMILWNDGLLVLAATQGELARMALDADARASADRFLAEFSSARVVVGVLDGSGNDEERTLTPRYVPEKLHPLIGTKAAPGCGFRRKRDTASAVVGPSLGDFCKSPQMNPDQLFDLRNKAIHFCLSVPRDWAELAWRITHENLEAFEKGWSAAGTDVKTQVPDWDDLCQVCGVGSFPPRRPREGRP